MPLDDKLTAALASREKRLIRRRLPDPTADDDLIDFFTNDYLSLASSASLRARFLAKLRAAPQVLGSGGSRLLVNGHAHAAFEARLATFLRAPAALLFNSGFDANVGFFASIPQPGDAVVFDEHIHASVHDGMRASRVEPGLRVAFAHNSVHALQEVLQSLIAAHPALRNGESSVFVSVEALYSMDGNLAPLVDIVETVEELFPRGNGYVVVDEAHSTGVYGPQGRGLVAAYGLEDRVFARLHTFGKALAGTGAVLLITPLVRDYLLNYARSLIYTTSLSYANIIAADCSFDLLESGEVEKLSKHLLDISTYFLSSLHHALASHRISPALLALPPHIFPPSSSSGSSRISAPASSSQHQTQTELESSATPIVAVLTPHPRPLSAHLRARGLNARPITWPTVPKGADRIRVCLHAGNTREDVDRLVNGIVEWAKAWERTSEGAPGCGGSEGQVMSVQAKL